MRVLKFGGSSVANSERFLCVANIIESKARVGQVAAVLSAPAKTTNHLVAMIEKTASSHDTLPDISDTVDIFSNLLIGLNQSVPGFEYNKLKKFIDQQFVQLKQDLNGIVLERRCSDSVNASIICFGERLSVVLMEGVLHAKGFPVTVINPVDNFLAHGCYLESTIDILESMRRISVKTIPRNHVLLMPGFIAGNEKGELVVLGRNGSDYSATVLAACLQADSCEIWTDVDGIYTCDPRTIPEAKLLKSMSYQEAIELSYFGAKILHPRTIAPIAQFRIPCLIKNTVNPQAPGTLISEEIMDDSMPMKGVTSLNNIAMINVSKASMKSIFGMADRIFSSMSRASISVVLVTRTSSDYSINFCVSQYSLMCARQALEEEFCLELKEGALEPLYVLDNLAIISVIGDGIRRLHGASTRFFSALACAKISIVAIAKSSSECSISAVVSGDSVITGLRVSHQMLSNTNRAIEICVIGVFYVFLQKIRRHQAYLTERSRLSISMKHAD